MKLTVIPPWKIEIFQQNAIFDIKVDTFCSKRFVSDLVLEMRFQPWGAPFPGVVKDFVSRAGAGDRKAEPRSNNALSRV
jgi:hypothetical protein